MRNLEEIDAERAALHRQEDDVKARLRALSRERDAAVYTQKLAAMPAAEREALLIMARGIESGEKLGTPGGS